MWNAPRIRRITVSVVHLCVGSRTVTSVPVKPPSCYNEVATNVELGSKPFNVIVVVLVATSSVTARGQYHHV
jgi:hypothetical protein